MRSLQQPFQFPKKLWLLLSGVCFAYLFSSEAVNLKGNQPTAWQALLDGNIGMGVVFGLFWLVVALAFGAFVSAILGILRALLWK